MRNEVGWIELVRIQRAIKGDSKLRLFTVVLSLDQFCLDLWVYGSSAMAKLKLAPVKLRQAALCVPIKKQWMHSYGLGGLEVRAINHLLFGFTLLFGLFAF